MRRQIQSLILPAALGGMVVCLGACPDDEEPDTQATGLTNDTLSSTGDGDGDGDSDSNSEGDKLDVSDSQGDSVGEEEGDDGCEKVDLLFVVDSSGSMADEQVNLTSSFPDFITAMQEELADTDGYHVGVITTDPLGYIFNGPGCAVEGGLVTKTGGIDSSNMDCKPFFSEGFNFMTEMDDLTQAFSCAAQVGTNGDGDERPAEALTMAVGDMLSQPGSCNADFLREDAILVIIIITDEEDDHEVDGCMQLPQPGSSGEPAQWFNSVIAAKDGAEDNIVVLSLVGPAGPNPATCPALDKCAGGIEGAEVATRLIEFTNMFSRGHIGRVCESSYKDFFLEAVGEIKSACDDFIPPD